MNKEEAIKQLSDAEHCLAGHGDLWDEDMEAFDMAIEALKQEPCEDEIILTKEEYGQLLSNEFDNGYAKGYREALEQESVLDKIRTEMLEEMLSHSGTGEEVIQSYADGLNKGLQIIDKYKAEKEG